VTALDRFNQPATGYNGTVTFSSTDPAAQLPAAYTFTSADQGVHTFQGVLLPTPGNQTISITGPSPGSGPLTASATVNVFVTTSTPIIPIAGTSFTGTVATFMDKDTLSAGNTSAF